MRMVTPWLNSVLTQPVLDRTGLTGVYDFQLQWLPESSVGAGPSIFTAVQEQLGLELKGTKGPVEMLVIDHVERPDEN
jgi:uncharacterized protein (TIGR03435 family)